MQRRTAAVAVMLALAVATGCRTRLVPYESEADLTSAEAQGIVMEVVESQPRAFAPTALEVTDLKLVVAPRGRTRTVIYFANMSETNIYKDRRGNYYFVRIRDSGSGNLIQVWMRDLDRATRLVDGLTAMRAYAIAQARDPARRASEERAETLERIREEIEAVRRERAAEQQKQLEMEVEEPSDAVAK